MKLFLAPIHGVTLAYYRNMYSEIFDGIDTYYAPFIATTEKRHSSRSLFEDIFPENNKNELNIVPQLLSNNGTNFRHYASTIVDMGYNEINWNIGCPFPTVTKKTRGSGILPYPDMIKKVLDEVCLDDSYNLTVKMRLGLYDLDEGIEVVKLLNEYPLSGVIIHGRTGVQKYEGTVDLDAFEVLYSACKHEVTYNGDIFTYDDYKKISTRFPSISKFMLGRGALRDPLLPSIIKGNDIQASEKINKIREFHDSVHNRFKSVLPGEKQVCAKMKDFWMYTSIPIDPSGEYLEKIRRCHTNESYLDIVNQMLNSFSERCESL